jgi:hypothetical protein
MQAQTTGNPTQSAPPAQSPAPDTEAQPTPLQPTQPTPLTRDPLSQAQQQQGNSSSQPQTNYPNEQERIRLAREAQERVRERRAARMDAIIKDTYSHKYDISFGYAYLRMRPGHFLQHGNEYGWYADMTRYFTPKFGITADLRGYYKSVYVGPVRYFIPEYDPNNPQKIVGFGTVSGNFQPFISNYSAMVGPQYSVRQRKNYAVAFQVLAGVTQNLFYANSTHQPGYLVGLYDNGTRFTAAATMPVDINLGPGLSFRIEPDYNLTTWKYRYDTVHVTGTGPDALITINQFSGTDLQHNLGFTLGLNYRFGRQ